MLISLMLIFTIFNKFAYSEENIADSDIEEITILTKPEINELIDFNKKVAKELVKAIDDKKLLVSNDIEINLVQLSTDGYCVLKEHKKIDGEDSYINHKTYGSKGLMNLLLNLTNSDDINQEKPFIILSLFRLGGNHGEIQSNKDVIGRAIDIFCYAGYKIDISNPQDALEGITKIISKLPESRYNLGLPRPGGENLINPDLDYFLPVTNIKQSRQSPTGNIKGDLERIKDVQARLKLTETIFNNKNIEILYMFPDATNHLHIKAIEKGKLQ
ncbi:MAG: hypothetical protein H7263_15710 [Candidatus Sericytochromatia bacterium]|nr:hypothetical protein [Candidatus Sericytochromatia bacterium]